MAMTQAKVIKIGNSYGVRLSRSDLKLINAQLGDNVELNLKKTKKPDSAKALALLQKLAQTKGALTQINDPVIWQRELRAEWSERKKRELNTT